MPTNRFTARPPYLAGLSEGELDLLFSYGKTGSSPKSAAVISQGEKHDRLYFILEGRAIVRLDQGSGQTELAELRAGESFGEMAVFDPGPASASVVASETMEHWSISRDHLKEFLADKPAVAARLYEAVVRELAQRLRSVNENLPADMVRVSEGWW
jgi:CRP/FNR family cyclic AMP-dependent transcriptional regulator